MTKLELLEDTIAYYSVNPSERRCINDKRDCKYSNILVNKPHSEGCAIGRHLNKEDALALDELGAFSASDLVADFPHYLPVWMKEMNGDFLDAIQRLHDTSYYWDDNGLSADGKIFVDNLKKEYEL
jgi:hypothetical protein